MFYPAEGALHLGPDPALRNSFPYPVPGQYWKDKVVSSLFWQSSCSTPLGEMYRLDNNSRSEITKFRFYCCRHFSVSGFGQIPGHCFTLGFSSPVACSAKTEHSWRASLGVWFYFGQFFLVLYYVALKLTVFSVCVTVSHCLKSLKALWFS